MKRGFVRFDVRGLSGQVTRATLRVYVLSSVTSQGIEARQAPSDGWDETTITHSTLPPVGATAGTLPGPVPSGRWLSADVTQLVAGEGQVSVALTTTSSTARRVASRESGTLAPQLVVETNVLLPDVSPPDTTIASGPSGTSTSSGASFAFTSSEAGSTTPITT